MKIYYIIWKWKEYAPNCLSADIFVWYDAPIIINSDCGWPRWQRNQDMHQSLFIAFLLPLFLLEIFDRFFCIAAHYQFTT